MEENFMKRKSISIVLLVVLLVMAPVNVLAGTASASANSGANGGQDCGKISKRSGQNTGAMTVGTVTVNGRTLTKGQDYHVENDGSTRPVIKFTNPLPANAQVNVSLSTKLTGTFNVNLALTNC
jgi:hypothetical protein